MECTLVCVSRNDRMRPLEADGNGHHLFLLELKQFNQIARWIFKKPGATRSSLADFSSKFGPTSVQSTDETVYVVRNNHESVPSARLRIAASSSSTTRPWGAQVERQIITNKCCELGGIVHVHRELEFIAIEFDGIIDVRHNVSDGCHCPRSVLTAQVRSTHGFASRFNERGIFRRASVCAQFDPTPHFATREPDGRGNPTDAEDDHRVWIGEWQLLDTAWAQS